MPFPTRQAEPMRTPREETKSFTREQLATFLRSAILTGWRDGRCWTLLSG